MGKKIILTQNELVDVIKESTVVALNEISKNAKRRNEKNIEQAFRGGKPGINGIKYIAVFTAQNPDSTDVGGTINKKVNHKLSRALQAAKYPIVPAAGKFGGNTENSFAVINIGVDAVMYYCGKNEQTSFIYTTITPDGANHSDYYEKENENEKWDAKANPYVIKDSADGFIDMSDANDNFTIIGNSFKYQIPFPTMQEANNIITTNFLNEESKKWFKGSLDEAIDFTIKKVGQPSLLRRNILYKGLL